MDPSRSPLYSSPYTAPRQGCLRRNECGAVLQRFHSGEELWSFISGRVISAACINPPSDPVDVGRARIYGMVRPFEQDLGSSLCNGGPSISTLFGAVRPLYSSGGEVVGAL